MAEKRPRQSKALTRGGSASISSSSGMAGDMVRQANRWRESYNPLRALVISMAVSLLERSTRGDTALLQWTFRFIERRFSTLSGLLSRCEAPLLNFDWAIKVKTELPEGATEEMAERQKRTLQNAYEAIDNLKCAIAHLHLADFRGYAHIQKHRGSPESTVRSPQSGDQNTVTHLECLDQWNVCRDGLYGDWYWNPDSKFTDSPAHTLGESNRIGGDELPLEDFIIRECPRPINEIALILFVRSNLCEKDWDGFIEIYGIPGGVVTMPPNVPTGKETEYETAATRVAEGGSGAIPAGSVYAANDSPRGVDPFTPRLKHLDEQLVLAGTGGKLTMMAESGSGTLAGGAHDKTFSEIANARAKSITECFQKAIDAEVLARAHPNEPACVYFELADEEEEDVTALCTNIATLKNAGKVADTEWLAETTGYELSDAPAPPPVPGFPERGTPGRSGVEDVPGLLGDVTAARSAALRNRAGSGIANRQSESGNADFAAAVAAKVDPVAALLNRITEISNDEQMMSALTQFLNRADSITALITADVTRAANTLEQITAPALAEGLAGAKP